MNEMIGYSFEIEGFFLNFHDMECLRNFYTDLSEHPEWVNLWPNLIGGPYDSEK